MLGAAELARQKIQEMDIGEEEQEEAVSPTAPIAIEEFGFGYIIIDGKRYERDVVIRPSGKVAKRKKKLSKKKHGTAHRVCAKEMETIIKRRTPSMLVVGTGQTGSLSLGDDAISWLKERGILYRALPTPEAIEVFRRTEGKKMAFLHVTC